MKAAGLLAVLAVALVVPGAATATICVGFESLEEHLQEADVVFTGTVVATRNLERTAVVQVHEVWKGGPLPAQVTVHGGPDNPNMGSSAERTFQRGDYLFATDLHEGKLTDNNCSATGEWVPELEAFRPAGAQPPIGVAVGAGGEDAVLSPGVGIGLAGVVLLVLGLGLATAFRR